MSLVLSGKQKPLQAGVLANVGGERLAGGRGMHAAPVCKVNPPVGQTFHFLRHASGPILATGRTQPSVIPGRASGPSPLDAMAECAFHVIRACRFSQGVQPSGLTSIQTPTRELIQRPVFLWQGNGRRYGPKASSIQMQMSVSGGASSIGFQPGGVSRMAIIPSFSAWRRPTAQAAPCSAQRRRQGRPYSGELLELGPSERRCMSSQL